MKKLALSLAAVLLPLSAAAATERAKTDRLLGVETGIAFPGDSTIRSWQSDDNDGVWIQDRRRDWYYGKFIGTCRNLDFAQTIAVDTSGLSRLDKYAVIIARGDRCPLTSFVTSAPPPTKKEKKAAAEAAKAAKAAESN